VFLSERCTWWWLSSPVHSWKLNSAVQFSLPLCIESTTTCDDSATKLAVVAGFSQAGHTRESANQCNVCRWTKTGNDGRRPSQVLDCQEPATAVVGRRRFSAQRKTELNDPVQSSPVQLSWVVRCALGFRLVLVTVYTGRKPFTAASLLNIINVKNCCFITMCKAHSKVTHIKQQKYFHHLKRPEYNTDFLLYPRPFRWWKYFCCFICVTLLWALHIVIK